MNVKAIETEYKGYRFRSRLEARWAVFFEEHGTPWQYEAEGFELPSGRYLPDFYLPTRELFIEVKPGPYVPKTTPKFYLAGRMERPCYRPFDVDLDGDDESLFRQGRTIGNVPIEYVGPYRVGEQHFLNCEHDNYQADPFERRAVIQRSFIGIDTCDVFFALIEDKQAFGTLVEIGYAHGIGKPVLIGVVGHQTIPARQNHGQVERDELDELWFAIKSAARVYYGATRDEVMRKFTAHVEESFVLPDEQRKAKELSEATNKKAIIVYGDPVEAFSNECACTAEFGGKHWGRPEFECWSYQERDEAALLARQARFEYGQSGAPAR